MEHRGVLDRRRQGSSLPSAMPRIVFRSILPERVFGSAGTTSTSLKHATAPISSRTAVDELVGETVGRRAGLQHDQAPRHLALDLVGDADHGALGHRGMRGQHRLDRAGRQAGARQR